MTPGAESSRSRILIAGANGMLGADLQRVFADREVTALGRAELDVTDAAACLDAVRGHEVVVNAAAYTKVDDAETHEAEAYAVNATGAANLAAAAREHGARFVQVSTDYVFRGDATAPYPEDTPRDPLSAYGRTKAEGERLALEAYPEGTFIVRTAWLYGKDGPNFARTMAMLAASKPEVQVVTDQLGQPTYSADLAQQIRRLLEADAPAGIYHGTNAGEVSWHGFAREIFRLVGRDPQVVHETDSSAFVRPAPRPAYSVLGHEAWSAIGVEPMRPWLDALEAAATDGVLELA